MTRGTLQSRIKRAFKRAGPDARPVPGALVHGLRHTYAAGARDLRYQRLHTDETPWARVDDDIAALRHGGELKHEVRQRRISSTPTDRTTGGRWDELRTEAIHVPQRLRRLRNE